jgi:UDP-N-acetyl-D-glucosamine dehydrogenase
MKITVIGQGYVGLPLAIAASQNSYIVSGFDINAEKIVQLSKGKSPIEDLKNEDIASAIAAKVYVPTTNPECINDSNVVVVCVPTPLTGDNKPDLTNLFHAINLISVRLARGMLIIIESTIEPGTCREKILPILVSGSGFTPSEINLVYSPERIDPINKKWHIGNTPKLISGNSERAVKKALDFYSKFITTLVECDSLEIAETAKLLENSFRLVNISFINEIAKFCNKMNIDIQEVIKVASTKPHGFMPFYPSIGVGGHCIPVDPLYLANKATEIGAPIRLIDLAAGVNQEMPGYFVGRAEEKVGGLKSKKVLVVGVSYKPNVADVRESPVEALIAGLKQKGAQVFWHDDLVKEWNGEKSVALSNEYDLAIIATPHTYLDLTKLGDLPILNTRGSI